MQRLSRAALLAPIMGPIVVASLAGGRPAATEPVDDPVDFLAVFDDPTRVAREVDATMGAVLSDCMAAEDQVHVVSDSARFTIEELTFEDALQPTFERSLGDILPQIVEREILTVDPDVLDMLDRGDLLVRDELLIEPDVLVDDNVIELAESPVLDDVRLTDPDLRLRPREEGYGIALGAYELTEPDENIALVGGLTAVELTEYEVALYGQPVADLERNETGGCAEVSLQVLFDEVIPELEAMDEQLADLDAAIRDDPEFGAALSEWSACVAESGVTGAAELRTLDDAVELTRTRFVDAGADADRVAEARRFELELAAADFDCRARTTDLAVAAVVADVGAPYVERSVLAIDQIREVSR